MDLNNILWNETERPSVKDYGQLDFVTDPDLDPVSIFPLFRR